MTRRDREYARWTITTVKDHGQGLGKGSRSVSGYRQEIDDKYIAQVKGQVVNQKAIDEMQKISIVYTPFTAPATSRRRR